VPVDSLAVRFLNQPYQNESALASSPMRNYSSKLSHAGGRIGALDGTIE
jgi:hypothetical protein